MIDLTLSDDEDVSRPPAKKPKLNIAAGSSSTPILIDLDDGPVRVVQRPQPAAPADGGQADTDLDPDQDLLVTAECGDVATRDYPHSRSQCAVHKFLGAPCSSNAAHCDKCYCYVCDCPASSCSKWGSGSDPQSHCNAHPGNKQWVELRALTRKRQRPEQQQTPAAARPTGAPGGLHSSSTPLAGGAGSSGMSSTPGGFTTPARGGRQTTLLDRLCRPSTSAGASAAAAAAAAAGGMGAPGSVEGGAAPGSSGAAPPLATPMAAPPKRLYGKLAGRLPPHWRELPHPSTLPRAVHMASLRLPVRARHCTIEDLQARLCSTGYDYRPPSGKKGSSSVRSLYESGMYSLVNLTERLLEDQDKPFTQRRRLELGSLRQQQGLRHEAQLETAATLTRVLKITVARDYKQQQLVTIGLPVSFDTTAQTVAVRLQEEEGLGDCSSEGFLVVARRDNGRVRTDPYQDLLASSVQQVWGFKVPCPDAGGRTEYAVLRLGYRYNSAIDLCKWVRCCAVAFPRDVRTDEQREAYIWEFLREQLQAAQGAGGKPIPQERPAGLNIVPAGSSNAWVNGSIVNCHNIRVEMGEASSKEQLLQRQAAYSWEPFLADPATEDSARPEHQAVVAAAAKAAKKEPKAHGYLDNRVEEVVRDLQAAADWAPCVVTLTCPDPAAAPDVGFLEVEVYVQQRIGLEGHMAWPSNLFKAADAGIGYNGPLHSLMELLVLQGGGAGRQMLQDLHVERQGLPARMTIPQLHDKLLTGELPSAEQPPGLSVQLLPYQRQTLHFMQQQEDLPLGFSSHFYVPLAMPCGMQYWYSPVWRHACLEPPVTPKGGFLAEQMGMGKTVEVLALLLSRPAAPEVVSGTLHPTSGKIMSRGTLVVCAVSLVGQWEAEVEAKLADENVRVYKYHGGSRTRNVRKLCQYDLVITTYGILASDEGGRAHKGEDALGKIHWHRVVFDEGQTLKNPAMKQSRAAAALTADRRWSCSGTPVNTGIEDLVGQCGALNLAPIDDTATFKRLYKHALDNPSGGRLAELLLVLRKTLVRHTKEQKQGGRALLALPSKSEEVVTVTLSPEECEAYLKVHRKVAAEWEVVRALPDNMICTRILPLLGLLTPLRRMCSGGDYTLRELGLEPQMLQQQAIAGAALMDVDPPAAAGVAAAEGAAAAAAGVMAGAGSSLAAGSGGAGAGAGAHVYGEPKECPVCFELVEQPLVTPCGHLFCRECILACLADSGLCPMCRTPAEQAECKPWQPVADPAAEAGTAERAGPSTASTPAGAPGTPCGDASDMDLDVDQEGWITAAAAAAAAEAEAAAAAAVAGAVAEAGAAAPVGEMPDAAAAAAAAAEAGEGPGGQGIVVGGGRNPGTIRCTSKLRALMADLTAALAADASTKALVFGQYGGSMGALEDLLTAAGVRYATIKGHMTRTRRSEAIKAFQGDPSIRVFLLSVRAGAVGITLTAARLVYLLEPCLNPSLEEQAVGRAWRLGQQHHVTVKRLVVQGSIEEHILEVRAARDAAAPAAAHSSGAGGPAEGGAADMGIEVANTRLHVAAAAGSVQADKQALRAAELAVLFKQPRLEGPQAAAAAAAAAPAPVARV